MTFRLDDFGPGFCQTLVKLSGPVSGLLSNPTLLRGLGGVGAGAGVGALGGGAVGAVQGYRHARQRGEDRGSALLGAVKGVGGGAARGALLGGAGAGALEAGGIDAAKRLTSLPVAGAFGRFGQRQMHGLTGWTAKGFGNTEGVRSLGLGASHTAKHLEELNATGVVGRELEQAQKAHAAAVKSESMGLSHLPGTLRSLATSPIETVKAGLKEQWHAGGHGTKALIAIPAAMSVGGAVKKEFSGDRTPEEKKGRLGRIAGQVAGLAPLAMSGGMPIATQVAAQMGAEKMISKFKKPQYGALGQNPAPPETHPMGPGLASPVERQYSDRATGNVNVGESS